MHIKAAPIALILALSAFPLAAFALTCPNDGDGGEGYMTQSIPASMMGQYDTLAKVVQGALPGAPQGWAPATGAAGAEGCYEGVKSQMRVTWSVHRCFRNTSGINYRYGLKKKEVSDFQNQYQQNQQKMAALMMDPNSNQPLHPKPRKEPENVDMPSADDMAAAGDIMEMSQELQAAAMAGDMAKVQAIKAKMMAAKGKMKIKPKKTEDDPPEETAASQAMKKSQDEFQKLNSLAMEQQKLEQERDTDRNSASPDWPLCVVVEGNMTEGEFAADAKPFALPAAKAVSQTLKWAPTAPLWNKGEQSLGTLSDQDYHGRDVPAVVAMVGSKPGHRLRVTVMGPRAAADAYARRISWSALSSAAK